MNRILSIFFISALGISSAQQSWAFGLGASVGQETVHMAARRPVSGGTDLAFDQLDVKINTLKFTILDLSRPMATGLYSGSKTQDGNFWNRRAAIGEPERNTQWVQGSTLISYVMGSSTGAEEIMTLGGKAVSPAPSSTNSFWGLDLDMGIGQYQFLKLPLELGFSYNVAFRNYTFTNVYDGSSATVGNTGGMSVNGLLSVSADLGIIPGLVVTARVGYDPLMSLVSPLYPDLISPGYGIDGGAEWMPLKFLSVFANYSQLTTGFIGSSRPTIITDLAFGGRIFFY